MPETATVESPITSSSAVGGSKDSHAPASAPAGTRVTHGTAGSALVAAAEQMMKDEGAASSAAQPTGGDAKPGDTSEAAAAASGTATAPEQKHPDGSAQPGEAKPRNLQLEDQFNRVSRNAQAKTLEALGLRGVTYEQIPQVAKELKIALGILRDLRNNPTDFHSRLGAQIGGDEGGTGQTFKLPDGRLIAEDGKTRVYSQDQILSEVVPALEKMITQKLLSNGTLQKVINYVDEESQRKETEAGERQRRETVDQVLSEARQQPHFKENEKDIVALIAAWNQARPEVIKARGVAWAVQAAYGVVLNKKVYGENYRNTIEQQIRDEQKKKAAGGSSSVAVDAGRTDGKKPELRNAQDLAEHMRRMETAGS